ncbi:hypothetical protein ACMHYJ_14510 [Castellaniella hirudinis]|uniref:hypothetical protein n=1 Tax=Castellaniella hirudinis TaxID=1144617 RepID=UPI0039C2D761
MMQEKYGEISGRIGSGGKKATRAPIHDGSDCVRWCAGQAVPSKTPSIFSACNFLALLDHPRWKSKSIYKPGLYSCSWLLLRGVAQRKFTPTRL